jgi:hypothetical protein
MHTPDPAAPLDIADALNHACFCKTLDPVRLQAQLESDPSLRGMAQRLSQSHPHLFSNTVVFLSSSMVHSIASAVAAIERVMALPTWKAQALEHAGAMAQPDHGPLGVFMGYDFHISTHGPQLIEINTNAGGALLNTALARAQTACCRSMDLPLELALNGYRNLATLEDDFVAMFRAEWRLQRGDAVLRTIAIVDDNPAKQYLAPEFELFKQLFIQHGLQAVIADAKDLLLQNGQLTHHGTPIDMVYNRVTDFDLSDPSHTALAQAYSSGTAVLTPHPHAHALRADKRHLVTLGNPQSLQVLGVSEADQRTLLASVPACEVVMADNAAGLWDRRRQLFFKPRTGFGARAVYRGDKLTRRVWEEILAGDYIAQALVPPSHRAVALDHSHTELKFDIRAYTYAGQVQLLAARTYSGQTTNFRTEGGGFAPVLWVPARSDLEKCLTLPLQCKDAAQSCTAQPD